MKTIWKYPIETKDSIVIKAPSGAEVLSVGLDPIGDDCIWMLVDPAVPKFDYHFTLVDTGHPCDVSARNHVGSWVSGPFVWHLFKE